MISVIAKLLGIVAYLLCTGCSHPLSNISLFGKDNELAQEANNTAEQQASLVPPKPKVKYPNPIAPEKIQACINAYRKLNLEVDLSSLDDETVPVNLKELDFEMYCERELKYFQNQQASKRSPIERKHFLDIFDNAKKISGYDFLRAYKAGRERAKWLTEIFPDKKYVITTSYPFNYDAGSQRWKPVMSNSWSNEDKGIGYMEPSLKVVTSTFSFFDDEKYTTKKKPRTIGGYYEQENIHFNRYFIKIPENKNRDFPLEIETGAYMPLSQQNKLHTTTLYIAYVVTFTPDERVIVDGHSTSYRKVPSRFHGYLDVLTTADYYLYVQQSTPVLIDENNQLIMDFNGDIFTP